MRISSLICLVVFAEFIKKNSYCILRRQRRRCSQFMEALISLPILFNVNTAYKRHERNEEKFNCK